MIPVVIYVADAINRRRYRDSKHHRHSGRGGQRNSCANLFSLSAYLSSALPSDESASHAAIARIMRDQRNRKVIAKVREYTRDVGGLWSYRKSPLLRDARSKKLILSISRARDDIASLYPEWVLSKHVRRGRYRSCVFANRNATIITGQCANSLLTLINEINRNEKSTQEWKLKSR